MEQRPAQAAFPFAPQSERVQELFASWRVLQSRREGVTIGGKTRCHFCPNRVTADPQKLWLCHGCTVEMLKSDGGGTAAADPDQASGMADLVSDLQPPSRALLVRRVAESFGRAFTANDLVVECWRRHPHEFSLAGYPEYPDSNAVLSCCYGKRGLVGQGWLLKVGPKVFQAAKVAEVGSRQ